MRILLCLLSEQHVPNLLSVHHFRPDRLLLVETRAMKARGIARRFLSALALGGMRYDDRHSIETLESEDNLTVINATMHSAFARHPSAEWVVNVTGGTKPMAIGAYEFFRTRAKRLVYANVTRPAEILDLDGHQVETLKHRPMIKEFLAGYGFEARKKEASVSEEEARSRGWWECARTIAAAAPDVPLLDLGNDERKRGRSKGLVLEPRHFASLPEEIASAVTRTFGPSHGARRAALDKYAINFLTGGWLECFLWGLLDRNQDALGMWDVRLGFEVGAIDAGSGNDFDIAFMHDHELCMIECKSGSQKHDPSLDVMYKVEAVIRQVRALRVRSWLALTSTAVLDNGRLKSHIANRAAIYNCRLVLRDRIAALARDPGDLELLRLTLFGPLPEA